MSASTALSALLGLITGAGLLLIATGWHGSEPRERRQTIRFDQVRRHVPRGLLAVGAAAAMWVISGWPLGGVLAGLAAWTLPRLLGRDPEQDRRVARIEAVAGWTEMLRDTLASAAGLEQAINATAPIAPAPIRNEIMTVARRLEAGHRLAPCLRDLADELADPTADLVISALVMASEQRARRLGELLGSLADAARDQAAMRMRIAAGRARTRTSVRVIVGTTLAFGAGLLVLNRDYLVAYDSAAGQLMLLVVGGLFALAFAWLSQIAQPVEPERFLTIAPASVQEEGVRS